MSDAGQPSRLKRVGAGLGWAGLLLATLLIIFVLVPLGANEGMSATTPTINSTPDDSAESSSPETWVLSSTVVTSTPAENAPDGTRAEADQTRAVPRSTPLIIQVPVDGPTTQPPTAPTAVSSSENTSTTSSSGSTTSSSDADDPTCTEPSSTEATSTEPSSTDPTSTDPTSNKGVQVLPDEVGSSGGDGSPFLESVICES